MEIKCEEEYYAVLQRLVVGSEYIDRGGLTPEVRDRAWNRYNKLYEMARNYRTRGNYNVSENKSTR